MSENWYEWYFGKGTVEEKVYLDAKDRIFTVFDNEPVAESHNCDEMGCGSVGCHIKAVYINVKKFNALKEAVEARDKVNSALREFARQVIKEQCWGYEMDGLDIQDLAEKLELITKHTATEDDVEDGDDYEAGDVIYKFTDLLGSE